jgi:hypothetical protein
MDNANIVRTTQIVNVGHDLRQRIEAVAATEGLDATSAARRVLRAWVEERERGEGSPAPAPRVTGDGRSEARSDHD